MKSTLIPIALVCACASLARADFNPIPLDPTSFNHDPVIEKTAPPVVTDFFTADPNSGTNKNSTTSNGTWYEQGFNTVNATSGFPVHASLIIRTNTNTFGASPVYTFQMPPDYHTNNCFLIGHHNTSWGWIVPTVTISLKTPAPYNSLSVLNTSGNGPCTIGFTVHFANGATQTGTFSSTDWWSGNGDNTGVTRMWDCTGLIGTGGGVNNLAVNHGVLWANDINLADQTDNVTSIDFNWLYGNVGTAAHQIWINGRTVIFGLAASTDGVNFNPLAISTPYTQDTIYEADAPATWGSGNNTVAAVLTNGNTYCSVTMDGNVAKTGSTWYEKGYYASQPNTGIPAAGSTINSAARPFIHYTMPSTYGTNCAYFLTGINTNGPLITNATIKFATPTNAGALAFLVGGGNGGLGIRVEIGYQGGASETNFISAPDWFTRDTVPSAYVAFGRAQPSTRQVNNTPDQFSNGFLPVNQFPGSLGPQPFGRDPRNGAGGNPGGQANFNIPGVRLYDAIVPVGNSSTPISTINLIATNVVTGGNDAAIFAVSASPGMPPVITTQPTGLVTDNLGNPIVTNASAVQNSVIITKGYQGTNNIFLITSNFLSTGVSYQWKKAPRGGGYQDLFDSFNLSTFVNVSAPNVFGANSSVLSISNATLADSGDYILVASNQFGSQTSFVATVMVLTTNYSVLVGQLGGDTVTKYTADGTSGNGQETFLGASDQTQQKWLSTGLGSLGLDGSAIPASTIPFIGPVGYIVTPAAGASFVNSIRFYAANDNPGRDPRDYTLEGSNDGASWSTIANGQLLGTLMLPTQRDTGGTANLLNPMLQPLIEVDFPNTTAYKSYRFTITNIMDVLTIPIMQLAEIQLLGSFVPAPPVWVRQPLPTVTAFLGTSPQLTALATGQGALTPTYQWYQFPATAISGATSSVLTRTNVQSIDNGTQFYCVARNSSGTIASTSGQINVIAPPTNSYPARVLADKPMSYWRLDEGPDDASGDNGVLTHDYAGGHNGTYSNVVLNVAGYNPASDPNPATQFNYYGVNNSFVDNINDVDFARASGNAAFSIEAWVFGVNPDPGQNANNPAFISKGYNGILNTGTGTGTEQYALDFTTNATGGFQFPGGFRFLVRSASGQGYQALSLVKSSDPVTGAAAWHHLVGVCDQAHGTGTNGTVSLYVDGLLAAQTPIPTNSGILTQPLPTTIGSRKSTQASDYINQWVGTIDDVAIYPSVLTATQVLAHFYAAQRPPLFTLEPEPETTIADNIPVTIHSSAYGPGTVTYQWWNSDNTQPTTLISGQTSSNLTFTTTPAADNTFYQVVATSQYGSVTSSIAHLTVPSGTPSFIVDLPVGQAVFLGHIIQLHVVAGGTAPFTYQWQKNGANLSDDYRTSGSKTDTLTIGYAAGSDTATYSVNVTGQGSATSTLDGVVVTNKTTFFGASSVAADWSLQGTTPPVLGATNIQVTSGLGSTARSAFLRQRQDITAFTATYYYQDVGGAGGADGATFCIQNDYLRGAAAVGGGGGSLGYSGILPSEALAFNIYASNTRGMSFLQNGALHAAGAGAYNSLLANVDIGGNANVVRVDLTYDGSVLSAKLTDTVTGLSVTTNTTVNIPLLVGTNNAFVGFTGADGGVVSTQVMSWGNLAPPPAAKMNVQKVGSNLVFSWPAKNGAILMASPAIGPTAVWTESTALWQLIGNTTTGTVQVTVPTGSGSSYLRLQQFP